LVTSALTPTTFTNKDYVELTHVFAGGDISKASKAELERFAVMLSRPTAFTNFNEQDFPQICETVRTLILVRISEESNREASRISKIALRISIGALVATVLQVALAIWPIQWSEPSQPLPISIRNTGMSQGSSSNHERSMIENLKGAHSATELSKPSETKAEPNATKASKLPPQ
jgi:hypothetical protein